MSFFLAVFFAVLKGSRRVVSRCSWWCLLLCFVVLWLSWCSSTTKFSPDPISDHQALPVVISDLLGSQSSANEHLGLDLTWVSHRRSFSSTGGSRSLHQWSPTSQISLQLSVLSRIASNIAPLGGSLLLPVILDISQPLQSPKLSRISLDLQRRCRSVILDFVGQILRCRWSYCSDLAVVVPIRANASHLIHINSFSGSSDMYIGRLFSISTGSYISRPISAGSYQYLSVQAGSLLLQLIQALTDRYRSGSSYSQTDIFWFTTISTDFGRFIPIHASLYRFSYISGQLNAIHGQFTPIPTVFV